MKMFPMLFCSVLATVPALMAAGPTANCDFRDGAAPTPANIYVLCENSGILATVDGGQNWTNYPTGKDKSLLAMIFLDANRGLIAGDGGVLLATEDGGKRWQPRTTNTTRALRAMSAVGESVWVAGDGGVILHSADGGRNWNPQSSGITLGLEAIFFADAQHGWSVGWIGNILRTTNGGAKWEQVQSPAASWSLSSVYFRDANNGWAVGFDGQILISHDGGVKWDKIASPSQSWLTSVRFDASGRGWITTREGFLITTDDGKTWKAETAPSGSFPNRLFVVNNALWAIGSLGVMRRGDADQTWALISGLTAESAGATPPAILPPTSPAGK